MHERLLLSAGSDVTAPFVEDVFNVTQYSGTGVSQTITNGINLSANGGLVWIKARGTTTSHFLFDTVRGVNNEWNTDDAQPPSTLAGSLTAFNTDGFTVGGATGVGVSAVQYAAWTFREAPKFFDIITWTGDGSVQNPIPHNLGVVPGFIIIRRRDASGNVAAYARLSTGLYAMFNSTTNGLNLTANATTTTADLVGLGNLTTSTVQVGALSGTNDVNASGATYIAYLFAHDPSADGIIQCGSYTTDGSGNATVELGWEPQFILTKTPSVAFNWTIRDTFREWGNIGLRNLQPNLNNVESVSSFTTTSYVPTSTGFKVTGFNNPNETWLYVVIRRGLMKAPTVGTSVFSPVARTGTGAAAIPVAGFPIDMAIIGNRTSTTAGTKFGVFDRKRRDSYLLTTTTATQTAGGSTVATVPVFDHATGMRLGTTSTLTNASSNTFINYFFRRATSFFDQVHFTGTGSPIAIKHNLGVVPELIIVKNLDSTTAWTVYSATLGAGQYLTLNATSGSLATGSAWNNTSPTASDFTVGTAGATNNPGSNITAYLFATCPGVSKVGSYAGNGSSQTINCGFSAGARFVMIKRTDTTGNWFVWDTARGIVTASDPNLSLNAVTAEVTNNDSLDTNSTGFVVNQVTATNVNVNNGAYIYLAIA